ncbi:MAG: SdpI family protein [Oscillospiraceae bacterium]
MTGSIFIVVALASCPVIMIIIGVMLLTMQTQRGGMIGYRTSKSQKSDAAWVAANSYYGRISIVTNVVSLIATILISVFVILKSDDETVLTSAILFIAGVQMILIFADIIATEFMLSQKFDKDGNPK